MKLFLGVLKSPTSAGLDGKFQNAFAPSNFGAQGAIFFMESSSVKGDNFLPLLWERRQSKFGKQPMKIYLFVWTHSHWAARETDLGLEIRIQKSGTGCGKGIGTAHQANHRWVFPTYLHNCTVFAWLNILRSCPTGSSRPSLQTKLTPER